MIDVYVTQLTGIFPKTYIVVVDGKPYDSFHFYSRTEPLTLSEQRDIALGYQEALDPDWSPVL